MLDFLFFYEHVNREVENDILVINELEKRGYVCELMPFDGPEYWKKVLFRKRAKVLVTPWLRTNTNIKHFSYLGNKPLKFADLQWEQVSTKGIRESGIFSIQTDALKALHMCWGEATKSILLNDGGREELLPVVGALQQDFSRKEFNDYYLSRNQIAGQYRLNADIPWILYISSFSMANVTDKYVGDLVSKYGHYFLEERQINVESQNKTIEWIKEYISNHKCEFIYRPHPTESTSLIIKDVADNFSNFHIISDYSVKQWGKVCNKVNLWISTSNAELLSMGINYGIVRPIPIPPEFEIESMIGEKYITTLDQFIEFNEDQTINEPTEDRLQRVFHYYDFNKTFPAYKRIANALEKAINSDDRTIYLFDKEQIKKSRRIFIRTCVFSFWIWLDIKSERMIDIIPIKKTWKDIIHKKSKEYKEGKRVENKTREYLKIHESEF